MSHSTLGQMSSAVPASPELPRRFLGARFTVMPGALVANTEQNDPSKLSTPTQPFAVRKELNQKKVLEDEHSITSSEEMSDDESMPQTTEERIKAKKVVSLRNGEAAEPASEGDLSDSEEIAPLRRVHSLPARTHESCEGICDGIGDGDQFFESSLFAKKVRFASEPVIRYFEKQRPHDHFGKRRLTWVKPLWQDPVEKDANGAAGITAMAQPVRPLFPPRQSSEPIMSSAIGSYARPFVYKARNLNFTKPTAMSVSPSMSGLVEMAAIDCAFGRALAGFVIVRNLAYEKDVTVRYSMDGWQTYHDLHCQWIYSVNSGIDCFRFEIPLSHNSPEAAGQLYGDINVEMCVRYRCVNCEWWDNNFGQNYKLVLSKGMSSFTTKNNVSTTVTTPSNVFVSDEYATWM
eukprot:Clim_evm21s241 gene=Clim_evmTU21s241